MTVDIPRVRRSQSPQTETETDFHCHSSTNQPVSYSPNIWTAFFRSAMMRSPNSPACAATIFPLPAFPDLPRPVNSPEYALGAF